MSDVVSTANEIQLYSDLIKIGIPALVGIIVGCVGSSIPLWIEKSKQREAINIENRNFRREKTSELIECLSDYSGALSYNLSAQRSVKNYHADDIKQKVSNSTFEYLSSKSKMKKSLAIAHLLNEMTIVKHIISFDEQVSRTLNLLFDTQDKNGHEVLEQLKKLGVLEDELFSALNILSKS